MLECNELAEDRVANLGTDEIVNLKRTNGTAAELLFDRGLVEAPPIRANPPTEYEVVKWKVVGEHGMYLRGEVFTDGSCYGGNKGPYSRAGWGIVQVNERGQVVAEVHGPVAGPVQSSDLAELMAAIHAVELAIGPIVIKSDSKYVVDGVAKGRAATIHAHCKHARRWTRLFELLEAHGEVQVVKVAGHATKKMVAQGKIDERDRLGNHGADAAARRGALCHPDNLRPIQGLNAVAAMQSRVVKRAARISLRIEEVLGPVKVAPKKWAETRRAPVPVIAPPVVAAAVPSLDVEVYETHRPIEVEFGKWQVLVMCARCGAYSDGCRQCNLRGPCIPTRGTRQQLALAQRGKHPSRLSDARVTSIAQLPLGAVRRPREWVPKGVPSPVVTDKAVYWRYGAKADAAAAAVSSVWRRFNRCEADVACVQPPGTNGDDDVTTDTRIDFTRWTRLVPAKPDLFRGVWPTLRSFVA